MNYSYTPSPRRRRATALAALDELVDRECKALRPLQTAEDRGASFHREEAEGPPPEPDSDEPFLERTVAYLMARPNREELLARIAIGLKSETERVGAQQAMPSAQGDSIAPPAASPEASGQEP